MTRCHRLTAADRLVEEKLRELASGGPLFLHLAIVGAAAFAAMAG